MRNSDHKRYILGLDVGGTKIEGGLFQVGKNSGYQIGKNRHLSLLEIFTMRRPTERHLGYEHILQVLMELCRDLISQINISIDQVEAIGIGLPGPIDPSTRKMVTGNTSVLCHQNLIFDLQKKLNSKVKIECENDANCFALAETLCGAGQKYALDRKCNPEDLVSLGIILGTGVGGGLIFYGKPWVGRNGGATEIGHLEFLPGGHPCYCGRMGCVEQYLSGPALEALVHSRSYSQMSQNLEAKDIFELALKKDPIAIAVVKQYKRYLARFIGNLINLYDPHFIVLGGGVSDQDEIYYGLHQDIYQHCFLLKIDIDVYKNSLGSSAGIIGAALSGVLKEV